MIYFINEFNNYEKVIDNLKKSAGFEVISLLDLISVEENKKLEQKLKLEHGEKNYLKPMSEYIVDLIEKEMALKIKNKDGIKKILLYGFPKCSENMTSWLYRTTKEKFPKVKNEGFLFVENCNIENLEGVASHFKSKNKLFEIKLENENDENKLFQFLLEDVPFEVVKKFKINIIFINGGPGSGKGTQCSKLVNKYSNLIHISTGDLLREEQKKGSEKGKMIEEFMKEGKLVSSEFLVEVIEENLSLNDKIHEKIFILLDGFPRNMENLEAFKSRKNQKTIDLSVPFLLYFDCDEKIMESRLLERAKTSGRVDDNEETIKKRIALFKEVTNPVLEVFEKENKLVTINANGTIEEQYKSIEKILGENNIIKKVDEAKEDELKLIFVNGGPGSGKGTQCSKLTSKYNNFVHISTGDLLREEQKKGSEKGKQLEQFMKEGKLVSSEFVVELMEENFLEKLSNFSKDTIILLDGFPRNFENLEAFEKRKNQDKLKINCLFLLFFDCSPNVMEERLLDRGKTSGRVDDNQETIKKRIEIFNNETKPILEYFKNQSKIITINANGTLNEVFDTVEKNFSEKKIITIQEKPKTTTAKVIFISGGPGSGKGTQCSNLIKKYDDFFHISTGDLLREELKKGSEKAKKIEEIMNQGKLVSSELIVELIEDTLYENARKSENLIFLLDGFPRNDENIKAFQNRTMKDLSIDVLFLMFFECSEKVMEERLLGRAKTSGRSDDNLETIKNRIKVFNEVTKPVIDYFENEKKIIRVKADIPGDGSIVFRNIERILRKQQILKRIPEIIFVNGFPHEKKNKLCKLFCEKIPNLELKSLEDFVQMEKEGNFPVDKDIFQNFFEIKIFLNEPNENCWVINYFPNNIEQLQYYIEYLKDKIDLKFVLLLEESEDHLYQNLKNKIDDSMFYKTMVDTFNYEKMEIYNYFTNEQQIFFADLSSDEKSLSNELKLIFKQNEFEIKEDFEIKEEFCFKDLPQKFEQVIKVILIFGGPGAGKGTQCIKLSDEYNNFVHVSIGNLIRSEISKNTEMGNNLKTLVENGQLIQSEILVSLFERQLQEEKDENKYRKIFLIDGFPGMENINTWENFVKNKNINIMFMVYYECSEKILEDRLMVRALSSERFDDNKEIVEKRLKKYCEVKGPILEKYMREDKLKLIDAEEDMENVFKNTVKILKENNIELIEKTENQKKETIDNKLENKEKNKCDKKEKTRINIIFINGGPGSGKGTQCSKLVNKYSNLIHISTGDLLREEQKKGSEKGKMIEEFMKEGKLVSSEFLVEVIEENLSLNDKIHEKTFILLDGFPRNMENLEAFKSRKNQETIDLTALFLLYFDCDEKIMESRLLERAKTSGRVDDNEETIKKRIALFKEVTNPVLEVFEKEKKLISVNANGTIEEQYDIIEKLLMEHNIIKKVDEAKDQKPKEDELKLIFVNGGPGSGKGTQCSKLTSKYNNFVHISTGDLLREEQKKGSEKGKQLEQFMKEGKLVSSEFVVELMEENFLEKLSNFSKDTIILLDGFPRNFENLEAFEKRKNKNLKIDVQFLLFFYCDESEMTKRMLERAKTSGRADDNEETIKKRIEVFTNETKPVLEHFKYNQKMCEIDATTPIETIFENLENLLITKNLIQKI